MWVFKLCRRASSLAVININRTRNRGNVLMAKIVNVNDDELTTEHALKEATSVLCAGGVVAIPTDTLYGIAASVNSNVAIEHLYAIKGREKAKPIAICVSDVELIDKWAKSTVTTDVLNDLFPGPVTAVFERRDLLNAKLNPGVPLVGIRIPDQPFVRKLVECCGCPLALTSANFSNERSTIDVQEFRDLWPQIDLVVDGGRIVEEETSHSRLGSTVVNLAHAGKFTIIREGSFCQQVRKVLKDKYKFVEGNPSS